jgi:hypothetical protein
MAGELFGTPLGDIAYHEDQLTQNKSLMLMGQLAEVPSTIALRDAQGREQNALAAQHEEAAKTLAEENKFLAMAQAAAQKKLMEVKPGATVADIPEKGLLKGSGADKITETAKWLEENGAPLKMTAALRLQASNIMEKESIGFMREQQGMDYQRRAEKEKFTALGNAAHVAGMNQQSWLQANADPEIAKLLPQELKGLPFEIAKPYLDKIRDISVGAVKLQDLEQKKADAERRDRFTNQQIEASKASEALTRLRSDIAQETLDDIKKNEGPHSKGARAAAADATDAKETAAVAAKLKLARPLPLDRKLWKPNMPYTSADGKTQAIFRGFDTAGKGIWGPMPPARAERKSLTPEQRRRAEAIVSGPGAAEPIYQETPAIAPEAAAPEPVVEY